MRLLAALRIMNDAQVMLQVLNGSFGANKTYWVSRPGKKVSSLANGRRAARKQNIRRTNCSPSHGLYVQGIILFFPGDQLEHALAPPAIRRLQDPKVQAQLMASKFAGCSSVV